MKFNKKHEKYFKDVHFLVEANDYEMHSLWKDYHYTPNSKNVNQNLFVDFWIDESKGYAVEIGQIDNRPITVSVSYSILNNKKIMFYYGCSQLVDHKMIENWLIYYSKNITYNGGCWAHCNAMNFHQCLHAILK